MGNLADIPATWSDDITQLETTDPVEGGPNGVDNLPHRQLASRTAWLKEQIASLATACSGFAAKLHGHVIGDTTGLKDALDAKSPLAHGHTIASITNLQASLDSKAAATHTHSIGSLTGTKACENVSNIGGYSHSDPDLNGRVSATSIYITPTFGTKMLVIWSAALTAGGSGDYAYLKMLKGTGTKPELAASVSGCGGTSIGSHNLKPATANEPEMVSGSALINVTPGQQIWLAMATASSTAAAPITCSDWSITAIEL